MSCEEKSVCESGTPRLILLHGILHCVRRRVMLESRISLLQAEASEKTHRNRDEKVEGDVMLLGIVLERLRCRLLGLLGDLR